jgi:competence protein ComEA
MRRTSSILVAAAVATAIAATAFAQTNPSGSESTPASPAPAASAPASAPAKSTKSTTSTKSTKTSTSSSTKSSSHHHSAVDLNTATKEQLMKLPGITDALADRIIAARPYTSTKELMSKANLSKAEYDKVHSHVMVAPAKKS